MGSAVLRDRPEDHTIHIDPSGLLTTTGGKWTTYRHMAEDTVNQALLLARLAEQPCVTQDLQIHGYTSEPAGRPLLTVYGPDAVAIQAIADADGELGARLDEGLPYIGAQIVWAARGAAIGPGVCDLLAVRTEHEVLSGHLGGGLGHAVANRLALRTASYERHARSVGAEGEERHALRQRSAHRCVVEQNDRGVLRIPADEQDMPVRRQQILDVNGNSADTGTRPRPRYRRMVEYAGTRDLLVPVRLLITNDDELALGSEGAVRDAALAELVFRWTG